MKNIYFTIIIGLCLGLCLPGLVQASELRVETSKAELSVGDELVVSLILNAKEVINAVEGQLFFSPDLVELIEIRDGNSVINFWVEKPSLKAGNTLSYAGITPGGFGGVNNLIISAVFRAKKEGLNNFEIVGQRILKNDGSGTEAKLMISNARINIVPGDGSIIKEKNTDKQAPEHFNIEIANSPVLFDNKKFVVFSTQDKGSGLNHYEIREYQFKFFAFLSKWRTAESPQPLQDQTLRSYIDIKVIDNAGNIRLVENAPTYPRSVYELLRFGAIIVSIIILVIWVVFKIWTRKKLV